MKQAAKNISKENTATSSNIDSSIRTSAFPGNPDCPICKGIGYTRRDLPIHDPDFGKLSVCNCRLGQITTSKHARLFKLSNLDAYRKMTFETFKPDGQFGLQDAHVNNLTFAYQQSINFARERKGWILFLGRYGCGKTHMAAAIANFAVQAAIPTIFLTVPDLLDWMRSAYNGAEQSFEERFEEIRNIPLLVMDDLGTQNATAWAQEKLFQILNYRYLQQLPTVITTNQELEEIEGRINSRLQDPALVTVVRITAPDFRTPVKDSSQSILSNLELFSDLTFGNFSMRENHKLRKEQQKNLELSFNIAREYADNPKGWLLLLGENGTGKTHLAAAIGHYRLSMGENPLFVSVIDFLDHLRSTFSPNSSTSYDYVFNQVRNSRLLILDGFGNQSATPWAKEKLFQVLDFRYAAKLPTVITSTLTLDDFDKPIRVRISDTRISKVVLLTVPEYR